MFEGLSFDELNKLNSSERSMDFEKYFGEMNLTKEERQERIMLAEELEDAAILVFILLFTMQQYNAVDWKAAREKFEGEFRTVIARIFKVDDYVSLYLHQLSIDVIETVRKNADKPYYYSTDRARFISENEANTILNYREFEKAVRDGKSHKKWIDIRDKKERESHLKVGGTVKVITEPFLVGDSIMQFPKDTSYGASSGEIVNCRCSIKYF